MKKKSVLLSFFLLTGLFFGVQAQDTKATVDNLAAYTTKDTVQGWKHSGITGLTFGQTSLTNWVAGGDDKISVDFMLNASANYLKDKWFWDNNLSLEYGSFYSSANNGWQKSADKINLNSIVGRQISNKWSAAFLFNFNTQLTKGYNYPDTEHYISTLMAPAYMDVALGFTYKPTANYTVFISPLAERTIFVLDDSLSSIGALGVDPGEKVHWETGAYARATLNQTVFRNCNVISTLDLFTPYNSDFGKIDMNWNLLANYKLSKLFTVTLSTTLRYYDQEIKRIQFKEIFGLGLTYNF
ncbi:hypothetical protein AGMMS50262_01480 [Bacteroidia bacterium]|nr:hypothetical protein AGMMS50262_01480 [Bacteroidia bacterium]